MRVLWAGAILMGCGSPATPQLVLTGPDSVVVTELGPVVTPAVALSDGSPASGVAWTSSEPQVVSVDATGGVMALGPGRSAVTAAWSGQSVTYDVTVDVPLMLRFVDPPASLVVGGRVGLHVEALLAGKNVDPGEVAWATTNPAVATVSATGQAEGVAAGTAYITARSGTAEAMLELRVE